MTVKEIIDFTRSNALDDTDSQKYLWENTELIFLLNRAYNELIKLPLIKDQSTAAIAQIKLLSNLGVYALDSRVLKIDSARLSVNNTSMERELETRLDATISDWRDLTGTPRKYCPGAYSGYLSIYPKFDDTCEYIGVSNISFVALTKTISQTGGDFSELAAGDQVSISGSGVTANNAVFTVATVGTTSFTVSEAVTNATNTSATIRKVRDTILMTVGRLGTARFTVADIDAGTEITEMHDDHVEGLTDGIAKRAFLKPDTYAYYPQKAEYHRGLFEEFKKQVKRDIILLHKPDKSRVPRSGTSIYY
jgi:hypothetical protein